jgi:hypothetical protein
MRALVRGIGVAGLTCWSACDPAPAVPDGVSFPDLSRDVGEIAGADTGLDDDVSSNDVDAGPDVVIACSDILSPCPGLPVPEADPACGRGLRAGEPPPERLSSLGCLVPGDPLSPAPGVVRYEIVAPLFSEGSVKARFLSLPAATPLTLDGRGHIAAPDGTLVLKTFAFPTAPGGPPSPVEVRLMWKHGGRWRFATWVWSEALADGVLSDMQGQRVAVTTHDARGAAESLAWWVPGTTGCEACHGREPELIGVSRAQLHRPVSTAIGQAWQLPALVHAGWLAPVLAVPPDAPLADPHDPTQPAEARARAWLHGNCAHCHQPGGFAPGDFTMDLRAGVPLVAMDICDVRPRSEGSPRDMRILAPGDPEQSLLLHRIRDPGAERMPPDGGVRVDTVGLEALEAWIRGIQACD